MIANCIWGQTKYEENKMHVEKQKIIDGIIKYIEKDVMPEISSDRGFQVVISIGISAIKANNKLLDKLFENDIFKSLANYDDENKTYDIDLLYNIAKDSISKCGYFPVKIPAISFISPNEKELKFSAADIDRLKSYIID